MGQKPLRPCRHPGCSALTKSGYCTQHQKPKAERRESAQWHKLYGLPLWTDELRPDQLLREPFCRICAQAGRRTKATVVDHVVPHRGNMALFADIGNLQSLCKRCHDKKTAQEMAQRRREK